MLCLPNIESPDHIRKYNELVNGVEYEKDLPAGHIKFAVTIECAKGIENINEIINYSPMENNRIKCLIFGVEDYSTSVCIKRLALSVDDLHINPTVMYAKCVIVNAAKAHNLLALEGVYTKLQNRNGFQKYCQLSRNIGFDGVACLNPMQASIANIEFLPTAQEITIAENIVHQMPAENQTQVNTNEGKLIAKSESMLEPIINVVSKNESASGVIVNTTKILSMEMPDFISKSKLYVGYKFRSLIPVTVNIGILNEKWKSYFISHNRVSNSIESAKHLGFKSLFLNTECAMFCTLIALPKLTPIISDHLGFYNCQYLQPIYDGVTLYSMGEILSICKSRNEKYCIIHTKFSIYNKANDEEMYSVIKGSIIDLNSNENVIIEDGERKVSDIIQKQKRSKKKNEATIYQTIIKDIRTPINGGIWEAYKECAVNDIVLHRLTKVCCAREVFEYSNFVEAIPHHSNTYQYNLSSKITVAGSYVMSASLALAFADFGEIWAYEIIRSRNINIVNPNDMLCAFSYILSVENDVGDNPLLQEIIIKIFTIKNIDPQNLISSEIPNELLIESETEGGDLDIQLLFDDKLSSNEIERICEKRFRNLSGRIVAETIVKIIRPKPVTPIIPIP